MQEQDADKRRRPWHERALGLSLLLLGVGSFASADETSGDVEPFSYQASGDPAYRVAGLRRASAGVESTWRIVLVPGTPSHVGGWRETLERGRADIEWIAIDRPGFGDSEPEGPVLDFADQLRALEPLIRDRPGRTILVGHSLGGPLVVRAGVEFADQVAAIVSLAGSFDPDLEEIHPLQHVGRWWGIRHLLPRMLRNSNEELFAHEEELRKVSALIPALSVPVVILHGTEDSLVPYPNALYLDDRLPDSLPQERITLEGLGHILQRDAVDAVLQAIDRAIELAEAP